MMDSYWSLKLLMSGSMGGSKERFRSTMARVDGLLLWKSMARRTDGGSRRKVSLVRQRERTLLPGRYRFLDKSTAICTKIHHSRYLYQENI